MTTPLERAVAIMDRLRSPGGCSWDAAQTHESLTPYLLEETYEVIEAIETGDPTLLREELGDLLLQVLFHARLAQEAPSDVAFGIDEVAGDLVDKLVRRHPHVFADAPGETDSAALNEAWEQNKIVEKGRTSAVDGVPLNQPALALAAKLMSRAIRAGVEVGVSEPDGPVAHGPVDAAAARIGARLLTVVADAVDEGVDPEGALRVATRALRAQIVQNENGPGPVTRGEPPAGT